MNRYPYTDMHEMNLDWILLKVKEMIAEWDTTKNAWTELKEFVETYFENLDVQQEINNKLDEMAAGGELAELMAPYVSEQLPTVVGDQIAEVVALQIGTVVAAQLPDVVTDQLPAIAADAAAAEVGTWLEAHIDPDTGYVIDDTLNVADAAADAKKVGFELTKTKKVNLMKDPTWTDGQYIRVDTGSNSSQSGYSRSDHVSIGDGVTKILIEADVLPTDTNVGMAFYAAGYVFISGSTLQVTTPHSMTLSSFDVPSGAKTFRFTTLTTKKSDSHSYVYNSLSDMIQDNAERIGALEGSASLNRSNVICDTVDMPMNFSGANCIGFGDSLMKGYDHESQIVTDNWVNLFKDRAGCSNFKNCAVGGAGYSLTGNSLISQITPETLSTRDFIFISAGTNDYNAATSLNDFTGAVDDTFDLIDSMKGSDTKVIVITPVNRSKAPDNANSLTMDQYRSVVTQLALYHGYSVIDGSRFGFSNVQDDYQDLVMPDGLHPSETGYGIYARHLYGVLL